MAATKRHALEDATGSPQSKKARTNVPRNKGKAKTDASTIASGVAAEDVDFPRGGGTSFTPSEVKSIRAEAAKEVNEELFMDRPEKRRRRRSDIKGITNKVSKENKGETRVEHLNYKRVMAGMKILGLIVNIQPLALIVSLPNQLLAHVPITEISPQFTSLLEAMDVDEDDKPSTEGDNDVPQHTIPDLSEIFRVGQYVRAYVAAVHPPGTSDPTGLSRARDEMLKASRRVELSLVPSKVNEGISKADLRAGFTLTAAIKSKEDHGYILDLGIPDIAGFLSFKEARKGFFENPENLYEGCLLDVSVTNLTGNNRTRNVAVDPRTYSTASLSEVKKVTSILPGALVQSLVTAVAHDGLNLQVLGCFVGTVDQYHLLPGDPEGNYQIGQKLRARVLYDISPSTPPRFALSLADHVVALTPKTTGGTTLQEAYPIGTIVDAVKVIRVETERGVVVEISNGVEGYVHISQVSDDHVPSLSITAGHWKIGTVHKARVTGYFHLDGYVQLSFRQSVLEQKFLQVGEVQVGEIIRGTVKRLTESALFVSIAGNVDGVIWPNHYADISLKHPQKRFKPGGNIKCRVLVVDPERKRVVLTARKTLLESPLPIVSKIDDAKDGLITQAVVSKVFDKSVQVEFYNNLKAIVPGREASEAGITSLAEAFSAGKPVQVKILSVDPDTSRILASIRQAVPNYRAAVADVTGVQVGDSVEGVIAEIQKEKAVLTLQPTQACALLSLKNLANRRGVPAAQLRASMKTGERLQDLVVVSRNPEKGFVLVATKPKEKETMLQRGSLNLDTIRVGQLVGGRVLRHTRQGALVKLTNTISGLLHPTDSCDDYETDSPFPPVDSVLKATVLAVDKEKRQLTLSTRPSRMYLDQNKQVVDRELESIDRLNVGDTVRGFIKNVAEHGLFVALGRNLDARVQIRELFDQYVKEWKSHFAANQMVKGRILSIDRNKNQIEMSFRTGDLKRDNPPTLSLADFSEGQKVEGRVKKVEEYGLFIEIEGSRVSGLCHKSELSDNKDADVTLALRSFREGDHVKALILSIDKEKRRVSLGLKPSYFTDVDFEMGMEKEDSDKDEADEHLGVINAAQDHENPNGEDAGSSPHVDESSSDEESAGMFDEADMDINISQGGLDHQPSSTAKTNKEGSVSLSLDLKEGFQWSTNKDLDHDYIGMVSSSDEDERDDQNRKKKRRKRKEIEHDFTANMHTKMPDSNTDFERVLLGSPNSSYLWIQYMSFQLQISEVDKAREIARRALKTINFREEQEKLNVWIALLNLENVYGTDESLEVTFKDAARHNESKTIHLRLATIFDQSGKSEKAEEQYKRTCKKFGQSSKVWTLFGEHYLKRGKLEDARKLLPRSLQSLEKRKHLKTISKFAQSEYKFGDPERGKTLFEGIVDSHPKRWDLWSVYVDMEAGQGDIMSLRNILDRVLALKMTSHKAKAFFKKWFELEHRLGDDEGADAVKAKAVEWTQRAAGTS